MQTNEEMIDMDEEDESITKDRRGGEESPKDDLDKTSLIKKMQELEALKERCENDIAAVKRVLAL